MRSLLLLSAILLASCDEPPEPYFNGASLTRTTLIIPDLDPAFALYRDILGFEVVYDAPYPGSTFHDLFNVEPDSPVRFAILKSPDPGSAMIGMLEIAATPAKETDPERYRPQHGEVVLWMMTRELDAIYQKVQSAEAGVVTVVAPPFETTGGREMLIADANGVRMYVFEASD